MTTASDYRKREESVTLTTESAGMGETHELLTLNIGPHHPATHGVLRLIATLEGEVVRDIKPIIGYVHTGIEKTAEDKSYWKAIPVVERMDYLAYYFNAMAFCGATETLLDCEVPRRAQYLRVLHLEGGVGEFHADGEAGGGVRMGCGFRTGANGQDCHARERGPKYRHCIAAKLSCGGIQKSSKNRKLQNSVDDHRNIIAIDLDAKVGARVERPPVFKKLAEAFVIASERARRIVPETREHRFYRAVEPNRHAIILNEFPIAPLRESAAS